MFISRRGAGIAILIVAALSWPLAAAAKSDTPAPHGGPKKSLSVGAFESPEMMAGGATGEGLSAMLVNALLRDGRFVVMERSAMPQVQAEQALGSAGVTPETATQPGRLLGASALVLGTVTKFNPQAGGGGIAVGMPSLFGGGGGGYGGGDTVGGSLQVAEVEINIRVIDNSSGQIIYSGAASGTASAKGFAADAYTKSGMHFGTTAFASTPLGQAAQDAIDKAVAQIVIGMEKVPWSALVIESNNGAVYISAGSNQNMQAGTTLHVFHKNRDLVDPATGEVLDTLVDDVGTLRVQTVRAKTSLCTVTGGQQPARGDIVKLQ